MFVFVYVDLSLSHLTISSFAVTWFCYFSPFPRFCLVSIPMRYFNSDILLRYFYLVIAYILCRCSDYLFLVISIFGHRQSHLFCSAGLVSWWFFLLHFLPFYSFCHTFCLSILPLLDLFPFGFPFWVIYFLHLHCSPLACYLFTTLYLILLYNHIHILFVFS